MWTVLVVRAVPVVTEVLVVTVVTVAVSSSRRRTLLNFRLWRV
jgi:hypothetical protein